MLAIRGDRLVVRLPPTEERTNTGLWIPIRAQEPPMEGVVLQVGDKVGAPIKPGDRVVFEQYAGLEHDDTDLGQILILQEQDLMAVIED